MDPKTKPASLGESLFATQEGSGELGAELFKFNTATDLKTKSEVSPDLIVHFSLGYMLAEVTHDKTYKMLLDQILTLMISRDRRGRQEYIEIQSHKKDDFSMQDLL